MDGAIGRRKFLHLCAVLGIGVPAACTSETTDRLLDDPADDPLGDAIESVVIVGAGVAGLTAAHLLVRSGIDIVVLEAAETYGGRIRRTLDFVDFPISLGAEWLHVDPAVLNLIADDDLVDVDLVAYSPDDQLGFFDGELSLEPFEPSGDLKFVGSSWLDVFERYVVPGIENRLRFDRQVVSVDASGETVVVSDEAGGVVEADAVIVTVPVAVLRARQISFVPDLTAERWSAIDDVHLWGGMKAFIEFDERFYPTFVEFPDSDTPAGQRLYYDAAYGQATEANVLGLFAVGRQAEAYQGLEHDELRDYLLAELDEIFEGAASRSYLRHISQDWSAEPFIGQAYVADEADSRLVRTLGRPAGGRVLFAGDAYSDGEDWSSVHAAAESARVAVYRLLGRS